MTSRRTVVRAAAAAKTMARAASSAAVAANGNGVPPLTPCAGPNAAPPRLVPDRVAAAV